MAETLFSYLAATRRLLHDATADYWDDTELTADINSAVKQRDLWSGGSRSYQPGVALTIGQDLYTFADLFPALIAAGQTILDVVNVWLIYGSTRVPLENPPFGELTNTYRPWTTFQNRPGGFARYGASQIFIAPAPTTAYLCDFDLVTLSTTFVDPLDEDPLPWPYTEPVAYWAAYYAKINSRRYDDADVFLGFAQKAIRDIEGARVGEMVAYYQTGRR